MVFVSRNHVIYVASALWTLDCRLAANGLTLYVVFVILHVFMTAIVPKT